MHCRIQFCYFQPIFLFAGMMRYSVPTCRPLGEEGDTCRPQSGDVQPQNVTVTYPDGSSADLYVHTMLCPCASGLECSDGMSCTGLDGAGKLMLREDYTDVDELNHLRRWAQPLHCDIPVAYLLLFLFLLLIISLLYYCFHHWRNTENDYLL